MARGTNAHRVEVEVGADGHASVPLSGAAATAPPAGTCATRKLYEALISTICAKVKRDVV
jgi:microcystin degradation protein MlrC